MLNIEVIWREYRGSLKAFLHSKVSDPIEVDDLLQEILIKIYSNFQNLKFEDSIKGWLFQIANRTIIDFYRKKGKERGLNPKDLWYDEDIDSLEVSLSQCVIPFINALPEKSSELLTAIDIRGEAQKDYAQRMGISYSTLKSRVQKSRVELKHLFERCCFLEFDYAGNITDYTAKSSDCKNC